MDPVAADIGEITPEFLSGALDRRVVDVAAARVGTGQIGATYRLSIEYGGSTTGPGRLVAKLAAEDVAARARVAGGYRKEVGFYLEVASTVAIAAPRCWYGAISDDHQTFTLLLDDLAPARVGVQAEACSVRDAQSAVENLVGLHAPRWNDPTLRELDFLDGLSPGGAELLGAVHVQATEQFVARYSEVLDADDVATLRAAAERTASWQAIPADPFSLVHGDYRLDNLLFHPSGSVSAVDWQTLTLAAPLRDLAYFLGTSLTVDDRRANEATIVDAYHARLVERGVADYALDQCFDDYRLGQLQGPLITVIGCEYATATRTAAADEMFLAMARRSCAAVRDLGSLDLVD